MLLVATYPALVNLIRVPADSNMATSRGVQPQRSMKDQTAAILDMLPIAPKHAIPVSCIQRCSQAYWDSTLLSLYASCMITGSIGTGSIEHLQQYNPCFIPTPSSSPWPCHQHSHASHPN